MVIQSVRVHAALLCSFLFFSGGASAQAPLQKVRIVIGTTVLDLTYPTLNLPVALGYWKDEGYDVEVTALAPPAQAISVLVGGQADLAVTNASVIIQAQATTSSPVKIAMTNGVIDYTLGVLKDSSYQTIDELKGKNIGVAGLSSGGVPIIKLYFRDRGIDFDREVSLTPTGAGVPAIEALKSGRVQGLMFWASAMAGFENSGLPLRRLRDDNWRKMPDLSVGVMATTAENNPKMVEAIVRGMAKATVFALANPDCVRRIQWKMWPATKASGSSDTAVLTEWDLRKLNAQLDSFKDAHQLGGAQLYGAVSYDAVGRLQDFLLKAGMIAQRVPRELLAMPDPTFTQKTNSFDVAAIRSSAERCEGW